MSARFDSSPLAVTERPLAQAGAIAAKAVGLGPEQHFDGARLPCGRAVRLSIRPGFDLSVYDVAIEAEATVSATTEPCLAIVVLLCGEGQGHISGASRTWPPTPYRAGTLYVSLARDSMTGVARTIGRTLFRLVELRLSLAFLAQAGVLDIFTDAGAAHDLHRASDGRFWLGAAPAPRTALLDAETIFADALGGVRTDLRMEGRALALFEAVIDLIRVGGATSDDVLSPRAAARLDTVRAAMKHDLAHPWSIDQLARLARLNSRRFKAQYRARFGSPAHADLQAMRIEQGRALLRAGASVTDASLAVGYASPSHFAKIFRRMYGVSPRASRGIG